jgi:hypothetical protein
MIMNEFVDDQHIAHPHLTYQAVACSEVQTNNQDRIPLMADDHTLVC